MDPLAELRDIHLPEGIAFWPPAPGWWLLAIVSLALLAYAIWATLRWLPKYRYRQQALKELDQAIQIYEQDKNAEELSKNINILLKKIAVKHHQKIEVSRLSGRAWLDFLDRTANTNSFSQGAASILATAPYGGATEVDSRALKKDCETWIRRHR